MMRVFFTASRGKFLKRKGEGLGLSIEVHMPDALVMRDEEAIAAFTRVLKEAQGNYKEGPTGLVFKGSRLSKSV